MQKNDLVQLYIGESWTILDIHLKLLVAQFIENDSFIIEKGANIWVNLYTRFIEALQTPVPFNDPAQFIVESPYFPVTYISKPCLNEFSKVSGTKLDKVKRNILNFRQILLLIWKGYSTVWACKDWATLWIGYLVNDMREVLVGVQGAFWGPLLMLASSKLTHTKDTWKGWPAHKGEGDWEGEGDGEGHGNVDGEREDEATQNLAYAFFL